LRSQPFASNLKVQPSDRCACLEGGIISAVGGLIGLGIGIVAMLAVS
jgi:hypothetical protein